MTTITDSVFAAGLTAALTITAFACAGPSYAQDYSTYYTVMHPDEFEIDWKFYYETFERKTKAARGRLPHKLDVAYGKDPKQRLDVYLPIGRTHAAPVLVFLHGGGNREGDRAQYGYVAEPFAANGVVTVVASYRLQPLNAWPAQRDDAEAVIQWVYRNIDELGGNPERIFLSGHSAGSRLTAFLSYQTRWLDRRSLPRDLIKGAVLISGAPALPDEEDTGEGATRSDVLSQVVNPPPSNLIVVGSREAEASARLLDNSQELADTLRATDADVNFMMLANHDHATIILSLGEKGSELSAAVLNLILTD